ncbi:conserved phage C-terminal domain-containing protein [Clostridium sp. 1001275B_160808_H3]|uniref:conserved phage C-terminal domain-containing protein n=1 Tax=Clostridium sp. 1001275B_160808_H3 TaxID=2787110 RepID=UPI0018971F59|nr:conserved phage C-terminal domain-containing protein [Clostridium sp. 1001275B_160808_H3]
MQFSFLGFSVKKIMEFGLDIKDLAILRYFADFKDSGRMNYEIIEDEKYYWVSYQSFAKEMPYLGLEKRTVMARMLKLRDMGILNHYTKKEGGTFSYFKLGNKFYELFDNNKNEAQSNNDAKSNCNKQRDDDIKYNNHNQETNVDSNSNYGTINNLGISNNYGSNNNYNMKNNVHGVFENDDTINKIDEENYCDDEVVYKNDTRLSTENDKGCTLKCSTKTNLLNNSSTIDSNLYKHIEKVREIIAYLNLKVGTKYKENNKVTIMLINDRLNEGYSIDDFKEVIDKKVKVWKNTEFEQYLTPKTLFGDKFEVYLNQNIIKEAKKENTFIDYREPRKLRFNNFKGRDYDYVDLEQKLLGWA